MAVYMGDPSSHPDISFHDKTAVLVSLSIDERLGGDVCKIPDKVKSRSRGHAFYFADIRRDLTQKPELFH